MTSVGFYKIPGNAGARLPLVCQLTAKAFHQGMTVLIYTENAAQTAELDELLWGFISHSFLPHCQGTESESTISITHEDNPGHHHGLLINLQPEIPGWLASFERAVEIIFDNQEVIQQKRLNFEFYKNRGYPLKFYDLGNKD